MNLYISDLHFGHANVIKFDDRPFADVDEMDRTMIALWNGKVKADDHVYIIGDFWFRGEKPADWYLRQLQGHKYLIIGNHDGAMLANEAAMAHFESVDKMRYVKDGDRHISLCHFPLAEWNGYYKGNWHIYGHIHGRQDETYTFMKTKERALTAAACINKYTPASVEELIRNNQRMREGQ